MPPACIVPILGTICGENGMFHGEDKGAALCETGVHLLCDGFKGCNVVKRQGAQNDFKAFRRKFGAFDGIVQIGDLRIVGLFPRHRQHFYERGQRR